jgi:glycine/D-amino acid oxidase-like deaminating enzyme
MKVDQPNSADIHVPLLLRFWIGLRMIFGVRKQDFQAGATYRRMNWGDRPLLVRWFCFVKWALCQTFVAIPSAAKCLRVDGPVSSTPMWLLDENPLANHPWGNADAKLPDAADVVVIGAGFTGGGCAYHWARRAPAGRRMVVLEMDDPASGSSGRNEGLVVVGRYFKVVYDRVLRHLGNCCAQFDAAQRERLARQFAHRYCEAAYYNADLIASTIRDEGFDCDYNRAGWVQGQEDVSTDSLRDSVAMAAAEGFPDWVSISPEEAGERSGMRLTKPAGFSIAAASWHPAKWVWCLLQKALSSENVELFTRTKVTVVDTDADGYIVRTDRGDIRCRSVIYATESYTPKLLARFHDKILPMQEQAASGDGGPPGLKPHIGVSGTWWFGGRYAQRVLFGAGGSRVPDEEAGRNLPSRFLSRFVGLQMLRFFGPYRLAMKNEWSGTVGYTPDEYPVVGAIDGKGQYIIGGMCGSGSGVSFNGARCICNRILGLTDEPDHYPAECFGPSRLFDPETHQWPAMDEPEK